MKKFFAIVLALLFAVSAISCAPEADAQTVVLPDIAPQETQMKAICELAVMECYYHNVAKYVEEDAEGFLWWTRDKHFWIEYSGVVRLGVDVSLVKVTVDGDHVAITLPPVTVQSCKVDSSSLSERSYIVDKHSAKVTAEDEILAFGEAQKKLEENASGDRALLSEAQQRIQSLLSDYVKNIGNALGKTYTITWVYVDSEGNPLDAADN